MINSHPHSHKKSEPPTEPISKEEALYLALSKIPKGKVITYGDLATLAGRPGAARWAGTMLKRLPKDTTLPWHRVINSHGTLSLREYTHRIELQRARLQEEGILFKGDKIPLSIYRW
ncbi:MGMT family protein [Marinibactrum halimedae]|uniref:Methylated-DNA-[protein]-cysteine S-methyltransferase DNA binding domain-containing protein n=1 Tax=Marinibactrum halimedae TaxID=1444977 RepID=A0AA37WPY5_9GAMM|nr:methylated-DNA--[protein]-cysteine S-methyltransferase [Marinibactrum halimedae]MCD9460346.1 methylated-DNA--[protein]-cysteine S-methyltransferase [Marinibactrum halimedae]GLS26782.1 hypothetical protein GCM10007877_25010 [Marinibactrum halimedae]